MKRGIVNKDFSADSHGYSFSWRELEECAVAPLLQTVKGLVIPRLRATWNRLSIRLATRPEEYMAKSSTYNVH